MGYRTFFYKKIAQPISEESNTEMEALFTYSRKPFHLRKYRMISPGSQGGLLTVPPLSTLWTNEVVQDALWTEEVTAITG
jgi:hypothetical protein